MNRRIKTYCQERITEFDTIPLPRKVILHELANVIKLKINSDQLVNIIVICKHNSRRSHFGQVWLSVAASFYGIKNCTAFSGGTEATAVFPSVVSTLKSIGFNITTDPKQTTNPCHIIELNEGADSLTLFSKKYNSPTNPTSNFIALLVCHEASEACPFIIGADDRIQLTYIDPKVSDETEQQVQTYAKTCELISREMLYTISRLSHE